MIDNDSLRQAFGTLERHAPAEMDVLAGLHDGIARRRRRRQLASVAGVAGVASLVALGVVFVAPGNGAEQVGAAAPPTSTQAVEVAPAPAGPALPFTVGWLPDGYQLDAWEAGVSESSAQYVGTGDFQTVVVTIGPNAWEAPQAPPDGRGKGAVDEPATVAGRPGTVRKLAPDNADQQLIWQLADGRWVMVGGRAPTVPLATLHKVAENLSLTPTPMSTTWGLRSVPAGYELVNWNGGGQVTMGAMLCPAGQGGGRRDMTAACVTVSARDGAAPTTTQVKDPTDPRVISDEALEKRVVDGVAIWIGQNNSLVHAQVDAGHWVQAFSKQAGADLLRESALSVVIK